MKKRTYMTLTLMVGTMAFTACSSDDILETNMETITENTKEDQNVSPLMPMTFSAFQEGQGDTRAAIDGLNINWSEGDQITIFDGSDENGGAQMFTIENGAGTTSATFTGTAAPANPSEYIGNGYYYALYPYAVGATYPERIPTLDDAVAAAGSKNKLDEYGIFGVSSYDEISSTELMTMDGVSDYNKLIIVCYFKNEVFRFTNPGVELYNEHIRGVVLPSEQTATAGSADPKAMIMIAKSDDAHNLQFKNVCAYVKVTPQFNCYAIRLTSKGNEVLAGMLSVNYNDGNPNTSTHLWDNNGTNHVTLLGDIRAGNNYYIAVRPESLKSGFTIEFLSLSQNLYRARSTDKVLELTRSNVKNLGEFSIKYPWTIASDLSGKDDNGNSWVLVSPTLKIAIPKEGGSLDAPCVAFTEIPTPDEGWELPTADELAEAGSNGAFIYDERNDGTKIQGIGFLRYGNPVYRRGRLEELWTSTVDKLDYVFGVRPYSGEVFWSSKTVPHSYIFKYTGN